MYEVKGVNKNRPTGIRGSLVSDEIIEGDGESAEALQSNVFVVSNGGMSLSEQPPEGLPHGFRTSFQSINDLVPRCPTDRH